MNEPASELEPTREDSSEDESPARSTRLKRWSIYCLIVCVILGAGLGIVVILRGVWGWFETRVILTTVTLAVASLCGLASDLAKTPRGWNLLPKTGLALTVLATVLILAGMWAEWQDEFLWKFTASVAIFAVAFVHISLLTIAKLTGHFRWVQVVAWQTILGLAALLTYMLFAEVSSENAIRCVAVLAIIDAALTLVIPLLHRICRGAAIAAGNLDSSLFSPVNQRNLIAIDEEIRQLKSRLTELERLRQDVVD